MMNGYAQSARDDGGLELDVTQTTPYPPNQPFIYDDYRRDINMPIKAYPESNRKDIMSALKNLQDKIRKLELERGRSNQNLHSADLMSTNHHNDHENQQQQQQLHPARCNRSKSRFTPETFQTSQSQTEGIHSKLDAAEERCQLLEQQLDCMRKMVQQAEQDRIETLRKSALLRDSTSARSSKYNSQMDKLLELEREQLRLTAMQTLAANKIQELEDKLQMERHYRRMIQNKAVEIQSTLLEPDKVIKKVKKKRSISAVGKASRQSRKKCINGGKKATESEHYRLNLAEIPFINGKSTGRSHSLSANFQEVLSLMKSHNSKLCKSPHDRQPMGRRASQRTQSEEDEEDDDEVEKRPLKNGSLSELLLQLQDEFGHMSFEHEELLRQIKEAVDPRMRDDLERELECLVSRMEVKGDQISRLRRYQQMLSKKKKKRNNQRMTSTSRTTSNETTSVRNMKKSSHPSHVNLSSATKAQGSLHLLKDLKRIQASLRADDIVWD